ncbi:MAG: hypothetical protein OXI83_17670, partial [Gemmatimonadota bacterium]|nr:hypothetical protein [Gemmatimonadota bacterium]
RLKEDLTGAVEREGSASGALTPTCARRAVGPFDATDFSGGAVGPIVTAALTDGEIGPIAQALARGARGSLARVHAKGAVGTFENPAESSVGSLEGTEAESARCTARLKRPEGAPAASGAPAGSLKEGARRAGITAGPVLPRSRRALRP